MDAGTTTAVTARQKRNVRIPSTFAAAVAEGLSATDLGKKFKIKRQTASNWMADADVVEQVAIIQEAIGADLRRKLRPSLGEAVDVLRDGLKAQTNCPKCKAPLPYHEVRIKAANSIADRAGLPKAEITLLAGSVDLGDATDEQLESEVVTDAADILDGWGEHEIAERVRAAIQHARVDG